MARALFEVLAAEVLVEEVLVGVVVVSVARKDAIESVSQGEPGVFVEESEARNEEMEPEGGESDSREAAVEEGEEEDFGEAGALGSFTAAAEVCMRTTGVASPGRSAASTWKGPSSSWKAAAARELRREEAADDCLVVAGA